MHFIKQTLWLYSCKMSVIDLFERGAKTQKPYLLCFT